MVTAMKNNRSPLKTEKLKQLERENSIFNVNTVLGSWYTEMVEYSSSMWKYDTQKSAKIPQMSQGRAVWGQRLLTARHTFSPFLILKCITERGPALTQTRAVMFERWGRKKEEEMRSGKGFYIVEANLLPPTVESGMIPSCGTILRIPRGSMWLPLLLATDFKEFTFSPGQGI